jgi:hypothetical protein
MWTITNFDSGMWQSGLFPIGGPCFPSQPITLTMIPGFGGDNANKCGHGTEMPNTILISLAR